MAAFLPASVVGAPQSLQSILNYALINDPLLLEAKANELGAHSAMKATQAGHYPVLTLVGNQMVAQQFDDGREKKKSFQPGVRGTLNLYSWGGISSAVERDREKERYFAQKYIETQEEVGNIIGQQYLQALRAKETMAVLQNNLDRHDKIIHDLEIIVKYDSGRRSELTQAKARRLQVETNMAHVQRTLDLALSRLARYTIRPVRADDLTVPFSQQSPGSLITRFRNHDLTYTPSYQAQQAELDSARAELKVSKAARLPSLNLESQITRDSKEVYLNLSWNFFDRAASHAVTKNAQTIIAAESRLEQMLREVAEKSRSAELDMQQSHRRSAITQEHVAAQQQVVKAYELQFKIARRNLNDVLDSYSELSGVEMAYVTAQNDFRDAALLYLRAQAQIAAWAGVSSSAMTEPGLDLPKPAPDEQPAPPQPKMPVAERADSVSVAASSMVPSARAMAEQDTIAANADEAQHAAMAVTNHHTAQLTTMVQPNAIPTAAPVATISAAPAASTPSQAVKAPKAKAAKSPTVAQAAQPVANRAAKPNGVEDLAKDAAAEQLAAAISAYNTEPMVAVAVVENTLEDKAQPLALAAAPAASTPSQAVKAAKAKAAKSPIVVQAAQPVPNRAAKPNGVEDLAKDAAAEQLAAAISAYNTEPMVAVAVVENTLEDKAQPLALAATPAAATPNVKTKAAKQPKPKIKIKAKSVLAKAPVSGSDNGAADDKVSEYAAAQQLAAVMAVHNTEPMLPATPNALAMDVDVPAQAKALHPAQRGVSSSQPVLAKTRNAPTPATLDMLAEWIEAAHAQQLAKAMAVHNTEPMVAALAAAEAKPATQVALPIAKTKPQTVSVSTLARSKPLPRAVVTQRAPTESTQVVEAQHVASLMVAHNTEPMLVVVHSASVPSAAPLAVMPIPPQARPKAGLLAKWMARLRGEHRMDVAVVPNTEGVDKLALAAHAQQLAAISSQHSTQPMISIVGHTGVTMPKPAIAMSKVMSSSAPARVQQMAHPGSAWTPDVHYVAELLLAQSVAPMQRSHEAKAMTGVTPAKTRALPKQRQDKLVPQSAPIVVAVPVMSLPADKPVRQSQNHSHKPGYAASATPIQPWLIVSGIHPLDASIKPLQPEQVSSAPARQQTAAVDAHNAALHVVYAATKPQDSI